MRTISTAGILLLIILMCGALPHVSAQPGIDEFKLVRYEVNRWYYDMADLALVIGAITGLVGGVRVYSNWQAGRRHIDQEVMGWFFSSLFLSLIGAALKAFFGVD